jgi:hypothetical protein
MKIVVLPIGKPETTVLFWIKEKVKKSFPNTACMVIDGRIPLREKNFDEKR